jgi:hypothetical protein
MVEWKALKRKCGVVKPKGSAAEATASEQRSLAPSDNKWPPADGLLLLAAALLDHATFSINSVVSIVSKEEVLLVLAYCF